MKHRNLLLTNLDLGTVKMEGLEDLISDESWRGLASWFKKGHLLAVPLQDERDERGLCVLCCVCVYQFLSCIWLFCDLMDCNPGLLCPWNFPGENIGVGCHFLLQGVFPTQGSSKLHLLCLLHRQAGILTTWATWEAPGVCYKGANLTSEGSTLVT